MNSAQHARVDEIRHRHQMVRPAEDKPWLGRPYCAHCLMDWRCDTHVLLEVLDAVMPPPAPAPTNDTRLLATFRVTIT